MSDIPPAVRRRVTGFGVVLALTIVGAAPGGASTAFRLSDLDYKDPHFFIEFLGCRDVTDADIFGSPSFNRALQDRIQGDADSNGVLDLSLVLVFDSLDVSAAGGVVRFGNARCAAPSPTSGCEDEVGLSLTAIPYTITAGGGSPCLTVVPGSTRPYTVPVIVPAAPCFVTEERDLTLELLEGVPMTLRRAQIAATFVGDPPTALTNGLIRGFLTEADANATLLPASMALIGGQPLSAILPGGDPPGEAICCASVSDKDVLDGTPGWWFYLNFPGQPVTYEQTVGVGSGDPQAGIGIRTWPNPFRGRLEIRFALAAPGPVRVSVLDVQGRWVADLVREARPAGPQLVAWDGRDARGLSRANGIYVVRIESGGRIEHRRIVLAR